MTVLLYVIVWFSWGGSWLAIAWQQGPVPVQQSISYRFALAATVLLLALLLSRRLQKTRWNDHVYFFLQGSCLYALNFVAFYTATTYISSGLVAVIMSTATIFNAVHAHLLWKQNVNPALWTAIPLGLTGVVLLFWQDFHSTSSSTGLMLGIGYALLGTWLFSMGNMIGIRHQQANIGPASSNAWGMLYGCLLMALWNQFLGETWVFDSQLHYLSGLLYLVLIASVVAFPAYLMLVTRIGAANAAYVLVATPVLALTLSTFFEDYQWTPTALLGVVLIVLGNLRVLLPSRPARPSHNYKEV